MSYNENRNKQLAEQNRRDTEAQRELYKSDFTKALDSAFANVESQETGHKQEQQKNQESAELWEKAFHTEDKSQY
ncbi:hypothetical protein [Halobacillus ihumii]|uniref:hypothetical protein n=1 Tax=Halobacillus ihumii TaxID=2686092 RepID=UPI0013D4AB04|nr:hypothetical protein [Halobacillus ihumii]